MTDPQIYQTTVMFADVAGSSRLYKELGDQEANRQISMLLQKMHQIVQENAGVVIKTIGDEIMVHFRDAADALRAATNIELIHSESSTVRIGMASGEVIEKDADLFGTTVNDAAAVAHVARGGQVITTETFHALLPPADASRLHIFDRIRLKGGQDETTLYRVEWQTEDVAEEEGQTMLGQRVDLGQNRLILTLPQAGLPGRQVTITPADTPFVFGRVPDCCNVAIGESFVSREHCMIVHEHGKFVLRDHSTNGTHVTTEFGQAIFLRRGDFPLMGSGQFAIGRPGVSGDANVFEFGP